MLDKLLLMYQGALNSNIIQGVVIAVMIDTFFGVLRAIKEHKFNSNCGIDGAIRKVAMLCSVLFCVLIDAIVHINLIGFIPSDARTQLHLTSIGVAEFFAILFIAYECVSILKNMALCGLPVKGIYARIRAFLSKYTDELPDNNELEEVKESGTSENLIN